MHLVLWSNCGMASRKSEGYFSNGQWFFHSWKIDRKKDIEEKERQREGGREICGELKGRKRQTIALFSFRFLPASAVTPASGEAAISEGQHAAGHRPVIRDGPLHNESLQCWLRLPASHPHPGLDTAPHCSHRPAARAHWKQGSYDSGSLIERGDVETEWDISLSVFHSLSFLSTLCLSLPQFPTNELFCLFGVTDCQGACGQWVSTAVVDSSGVNKPQTSGWHSSRDTSAPAWDEPN